MIVSIIDKSFEDYAMLMQPLAEGVRLPELYHLKVGRDYIKVLMPKWVWCTLVEEFQGMESALPLGFVCDPVRADRVGVFGVRGIARVVPRNVEEKACVHIPTHSTKSDLGERAQDIRDALVTFRVLLDMLCIMLASYREMGATSRTKRFQLFVVTTQCPNTLPEYGSQSCEFDVTLAPKFLEQLSCLFRIGARRFQHIPPMMYQQYEILMGRGSAGDRVDFCLLDAGGPHSYHVALVLKAGGMSIGAAGDGWGAQGAYFRGHNIDCPEQQMVLLVGVISVLQLVRGAMLQEERIARA